MQRGLSRWWFSCSERLTVPPYSFKLRSTDTRFVLSCTPSRLEIHALMSNIQNPDPRVVCLIDGDSALFARELYEQGWNGGTKACRNVIDAIRQGATEPHARRYDVQVYCFASKDNVIKAFSDHANGVSSAFSVQFDDFVKGFNSVEPGQAVMVDMRRGSEKSDVTVKGDDLSILLLLPFAEKRRLVFLKREVQSPQVSSVIIAGTLAAHNIRTFAQYHAARYESYISELSGLRNSGFADKLKLLPSSVDRNDDCRHLQLGIMHPIRNVFQSGQSQSWRRGASSMNGHGASTDSPPTSSGSGSNPTSPTVVVGSNCILLQQL